MSTKVSEYFSGMIAMGADMETSDQAVAELAKKLGARLLMKGMKLATAESCTGGWIAKVATDIAGSSDWFECAIVSYSNEAKKRLLKVPDGVLLDHGAVSENTVMAMQQGIFLETGADASISVSGIAGPGGGSDEKPVGTVWIAAGLRDQMVHTRKYQFQGDRNAVRLQTVEAALSNLLELLEHG